MKVSKLGLVFFYFLFILSYPLLIFSSQVSFIFFKLFDLSLPLIFPFAF